MGEWSGWVWVKGSTGDQGLEHNGFCGFDAGFPVESFNSEGELEDSKEHDCEARQWAYIETLAFGMEEQSLVGSGDGRPRPI